MPRSNGTSSPKRKMQSSSGAIILNNRHTQYPVIAKVCRLLGWQTTSDTSHPNTESDSEANARDGNNSPTSPNYKEAALEWFVCWVDSGLGIDKLVRSAKCYQRLNHFPGMVNIYRKSHLARSMLRMQKVAPSEYDFFPKTWILPFEANEVSKYLDGGKDRCVIVKPSGGAQGRGIYLAMNSKNIKCNEDAVAQVYISRPLLIDGLKFDLRIYVLITCVDPLRVLIYDEGLVRLCTTPYCVPDCSNITCTYMHLTNYSVNKHNPDFQQPSESAASSTSQTASAIPPISLSNPSSNNPIPASPPRSTQTPYVKTTDNLYSAENSSSKRSLGWLWAWMESRNMNSTKTKADIADVVVKTLISIQATLSQCYHACKVESRSPFTCFEVLGFDILLQDSLEPVLVEVNHMPSFRTDSALDSRVKVGLIQNTLKLLNISADDRKKFQLQSALESQIRLYGKTFSGTRSKKSSKQESLTALWTAYSKNEARNIGNFHLIYPTNIYPNQRTSGHQATYLKLLLKAQQSLGSVTSMSTVDMAAGVLDEIFQRVKGDQADDDSVDESGEAVDTPGADSGSDLNIADNSNISNEGMPPITASASAELPPPLRALEGVSRLVTTLQGCQLASTLPASQQMAPSPTSYRTQHANKGSVKASLNSLRLSTSSQASIALRINSQNTRSLTDKKVPKSGHKNNRCAANSSLHAVSYDGSDAKGGKSKAVSVGPQSGSGNGSGGAPVGRKSNIRKRVGRAGAGQGSSSSKSERGVKKIKRVKQQPEIERADQREAEEQEVLDENGVRDDIDSEQESDVVMIKKKAERGLDAVMERSGVVNNDTCGTVTGSGIAAVTRMNDESDIQGTGHSYSDETTSYESDRTSDDGLELDDEEVCETGRSEGSIGSSSGGEVDGRRFKCDRMKKNAALPVQLTLAAACPLAAATSITASTTTTAATASPTTSATAATAPAAVFAVHVPGLPIPPQGAYNQHSLSFQASLFNDDAPDLPSIPLPPAAASQSCMPLKTADDEQIERLRAQYMFLRTHWLEQYNDKKMLSRKKKHSAGSNQ